jgi:membrane protein implicated in regulation of membrane protease activity
MKVRRWEMPDEPLPERPYRNTAILHAAFSVIIVLVAWLTGGDLGKAVVVAVLFFVVATTWSYWRWSKRLEEERRRSEGQQGRAAPSERGSGR